MSKLLSVDLRERVVAAVDGGLSRRKAAERFGVSISSDPLDRSGASDGRRSASAGRRGQAIEAD